MFLIAGCAPPKVRDMCVALSAPSGFRSSVALTVIKQKYKIELRIQYLQAINNIFKLQAHELAVPVAFVVCSDV